MAKTNRIPIKEQEPTVRNKNFTEVVLGYSLEEAQLEAARCIQCKLRPCVAGCPIGVQIPEFVHAIAQGNFQEAGLKIQENHLFPAICGRVCPQELQCEAKCTLKKAGTPIAIGTLERFAGDWLRQHKKDVTTIPNIPKNGKKIAVVGTGPAGLTAATEMLKKGFDVTLFEAFHVVGGVLSYGIPDFRLPKEILQEELQQLQAAGVTIVNNFVIGKTATVDELLNEEKFAAVFIGSGAGLPIFMDIPGEYSTGVYAANEYLTRINLMRAHIPGNHNTIMRGKTVVVGGGNIAMDAARVALRLGAPALLVYRRTEDEMPARLDEIRHAKEEGVEFHFLANPVEIMANQMGMVTGIKCIKMQLDGIDQRGRKKVTALKGSEFVLPCDVVVMAIGNKSNPLIQESTPDLQVTPQGTIASPAGDGRTSKKFVYVAGDILTGASTVISAIATAKLASQSMLEDLEML